MNDKGKVSVTFPLSVYIEAGFHGIPRGRFSWFKKPGEPSPWSQNCEHLMTIIYDRVLGLIFEEILSLENIDFLQNKLYY